MSGENRYCQSDHDAQDARGHRDEYKVRSLRMSKLLGSWEALVAWVRHTFGEVRDFGEGELLHFLVDGEGIGMYRFISITSTQWVSLGVKLGKDTDVPAVTALHASFELPIGGLAVAHNYLFVVQKLPLPLLTEELVEETLRGLVKQGRAIRSAIAKDPDVANLFGHFTE